MDQNTLSSDTLAFWLFPLVQFYNISSKSNLLNIGIIFTKTSEERTVFMFFMTRYFLSLLSYKNLKQLRPNRQLFAKN